MGEAVGHGARALHAHVADGRLPGVGPLDGPSAAVGGHLTCGHTASVLRGRARSEGRISSFFSTSRHALLGKANAWGSAATYLSLGDGDLALTFPATSATLRPVGGGGACPAGGEGPEAGEGMPWAEVPAEAASVA